MRRYRLRTCWLLACLLMAPVLGAAPALQERLTACAGIKDESERLACFEAVSQDLEQPDETGSAAREVESPGSPEADEIRDGDPSGFGLEHRTDLEVAEITARVAEVREARRGILIVTLDNGQVWRQMDHARLRLEQGQVIFIRRGVFYSFFLQAEGSRREIRVKRLK